MELKAMDSRRTVGIAAGAAVAIAMVLTACSSGSSGGAAAGASTSPVAGSGSVATTVRVETHSGPLGTFLTDGTGRALYMFASDSSSKSTCTGACATYWPALTTNGKASAVGGAKAADLSTIKRSDGTRQVTYAGHPLYYYVGDSKPGDTGGEGLSDFGANWYLLAASGKSITGASSSGASSTMPATAPSGSTSGGGGDTWG